ncbi:MAG: aminopeptidase P family protein [Armatimonadetes bacterium]|nr:aminopeptidase P family protein [Armatimonadota bacterium]
MFERISILGKALKDNGADVFLATHPITMGYLCGLFEDGHERLLTLAIHSSGEYRLLCPALTEAQARRVGLEEVVTHTDSDNAFDLIRDLAGDWNLKTAVVAVDAEMRADILLGIQDVLPAALFRPGQAILAELMAVKSLDELDLMQKSGAIADAAFQAVLPKLQAGMTESEVVSLLESEMTKRDGVPLFAIAATGAMGAEPHHRSDGTILREGDVLILDFGCTYKGYCSDITRTVAIGKASEEAHKVYRTVWRAHEAARHAVKEGVSGAEIDRKARAVIEDAGMGRYFIHRTGHGIGMRAHEDPNIASSNNEPLVMGNCFSIEPGVYRPGEFGVRIENIYSVGRDGAVSMNEPPSEILIEVL